MSEEQGKKIKTLIEMKTYGTRSHVSVNGAEVAATAGGALVEVYCLDDNCPWRIVVQPGAIGIIQTEEVEA